MDNEPNEGPEERLAARLRREADAARPAFSESLHARFLAAADRSEPAAHPPPARPFASRIATYFGAVACAAAILVAAVLWGPGLVAPPADDGATALVKPSPDPIAGLGALAALGDETASDVGEFVNSTLARTKWAYLDRDAETAARMLADRLPLKMLVSKDDP